MPDKDDQRVLSRTIQLLADEKRPKPTKAPVPVLVLPVMTRSSSLPKVPKESTRQSEYSFEGDNGYLHTNPYARGSFKEYTAHL
ncbi:hypothetical protein BDV29DRAFT_163982 [Aspergillus leporis]|uniref:Uncharacterized protein n=1 Tax=Aspergillus leporis TaxID=41062 RepID=A0A5N5WFM9_9EURO|nr:hypothetical protein BDV29DRAFT_163982 [Aspergillus leporis]